jgi:ABC-type Mn2+/Zn2+ transport system permease subunit
MSLRVFHMVFVALSVILTAFFTAWAAGQYRLEHDTGYALAGAASLAAGAALAVYGAAFQRKTKRL